jgi:hypothetical protein
LEGKRLRSISASPDKRSLREASRDFNITLIFAELIDNSIDRFAKNNPSKHDSLRIAIKFDETTNSCIYEDNAGGFSEENLVNFFRPGGTDNDPLGRSIGSYAWGAKKARSALADSVDLLTKADTTPALLATIDEHWDQRDDDWSIRMGKEGESFTLPPSGKIEPGRTRVVFKNLKPLIQPTPALLHQLRQDLGEIYALLITGHPHCPNKFQLDIIVQGQPVTATANYEWTQYADAKNDLHPRSYIANRRVRLPFVSASGDEEAEVQEQSVTLILEIGVKMDTGCATGEITRSNLFDPSDDWGIDVYGNGRLVQRNVRQLLGFSDDLIAGQQAAKLVKGRLVIVGSSYAIPWDTHKTRVISNHPTLLAINEAFLTVVQAFIKVAKIVGRREKEAITTKLMPNPWNGKWTKGISKRKSLSFVFDMDLTKQRSGTANPLPSVRKDKSKTEKKNFTVKFPVSRQEQNALCAWLAVEEKHLSLAVKKRVLRDAGIDVDPKGPELGINSEAFIALRTAIPDPRVLAKLQAAGITSATEIKSAGKARLSAAGLTKREVTLLIKAIG